MEIYRIENLTFSYPGREASVLNNINLSIKSGEFITLIGPSGCGKTTLLRHLKPSSVPHGERSGTVYFKNTDLTLLNVREAAADIGFVRQSPENQIVTDKVWHELAFGLESLGLKTPEIRLRVAEMASYFGIHTWFHKSVTELSGGQKQLLALASIMAMQPSALLLDEPTSQLDPIAASDFIATIGKINRELGVTVILTEHRLEETFPLSTRVIAINGGCVIASGSPKETALQLRNSGGRMFLPTPMRVWAHSSAVETEVPLTVREGADWLSSQAVDGSRIPRDTKKQGLNTAIELDNIWFKYEKNMPDILRGLSFKASYGEITAILGGNGTGKTTALYIMAGLYQPYRGKVMADNTVYMLPQNPQSLFTAKTLREDLFEILSERKLKKDEKQSLLISTLNLCRLNSLLENHPYDLSGGEQQRAAFAKLLLLQPKILLLDEPTKGFDAEFKKIFASILQKLAKDGTAIIMVSHDVEFCAEHAKRCALFFDGSIVTQNTPRAFFTGNSFYTTAANRMARSILPEAVTAEDIILSLGGSVVPIEPEGGEELGVWEEIPPKPRPDKLSAPRKCVAAVSGLLLAVAFIFAAINYEDFLTFISGGNQAVNIAAGGLFTAVMLLFAAGLAGLTLAFTYKRQAVAPPMKEKLSKRTVAAAIIVLLAIPLTIYIGLRFFGDRKYYFVSILIIIETMLPFVMIFEKRKPQARELVVIAVLCAIAVAGRTALFMLPHFKPVAALVIIAGVAFGGEAGFLVGAMTGFISNIFFGQGPWTPYQMFAYGIIGFLAGVLFRKGLLRRRAVSLSVFGALSAFFIYGGIMNPASVLIWQSGESITLSMVLASYIQGLSPDLVHSASTAFFLALLSNPMLEKLDRIKVKYGLLEHNK